MSDVFTDRWKVYSAPLRPGFPGKIIEVVAVETGETVVPWMGFDDSHLSQSKRMRLAKHIAAAHNRSLRQAKEQSK